MLVAHQTLYYGGILHCDVSVGNILICPEDNDEQKTHGELIGLDYAKLTMKFTPPIPFADCEEWDASLKRAHHVFSVFCRGVDITAEAFYALWMRYNGDAGEVSNYVRDILKVKELKDSKQPVSSSRNLTLQCLI